jgi:hypothetical protein
LKTCSRFMSLPTSPKRPGLTPSSPRAKLKEGFD